MDQAENRVKTKMSVSTGDSGAEQAHAIDPDSMLKTQTRSLHVVHCSRDRKPLTTSKARKIVSAIRASTTALEGGRHWVALVFKGITCIA